MVLTKIVFTLALLVAGQPPADVVYTNLRSGRIPSVIDPTRSAEIREMQLFVSPDRGRTWNQVDKITPDKDGFTYSTPADGEYWYHVVIVNQQGKQEPADLYKTPPMMKLIVDTKPPELKITSAQRQGDDLVVSWLVHEDNPDPAKLKLEYRTADSTVWTPIPLTPVPKGTATARLSTSAPLVVSLAIPGPGEQCLRGGRASAGQRRRGWVQSSGQQSQRAGRCAWHAHTACCPGPNAPASSDAGLSATARLGIAKPARRRPRASVVCPGS